MKGGQDRVDATRSGIEADFPDCDQAAAAVITWFAILEAVTLQTAHLTLPVGFSLFCLKGVCLPGVAIDGICKGVIPFAIRQFPGLFIVFEFPSLVNWLPSVAYGN